MAKWRKMAIDSFEDLKNKFSDKDYSVYTLFSDLRRKLSNCLHEKNTEEIRKIFSFARWCAAQKDADLSNAAGVSFYEHLFENRTHVQTIIPYLNREDVRDYMELWVDHTDPAVLEEAKQILKRLGKL